MASFVLSFTDKWSHTPTFISDLGGASGSSRTEVLAKMDLTFNYLELRIAPLLSTELFQVVKYNSNQNVPFYNSKYTPASFFTLLRIYELCIYDFTSNF